MFTISKYILKFSLVVGLLLVAVFASCTADKGLQNQEPLQQDANFKTTITIDGDHDAHSFAIAPPSAPAPPEVEKPREKMYGVIVDCGSSGSRVHMFQWFAGEDKHVIGGIEAITGENGKPKSIKTARGLSTVKTAAEAIVYTKPLLEFVKNNLPEGQLSKTAVYFFATAGMRLVDSTTQLEIMNAIMDFVRSEYGVISARVRIITGWEEGLFQWVTVKSLTKNFNKPNFGIREPVFGTNIKDFDGIVEMGGASLQVAFSVDDEIYEKINKRVNLEIPSFKDLLTLRAVNSRPDNKVKVISVSFLGLGVNSVRQLSYDMLITQTIEKLLQSIENMGKPEKIIILKAIFTNMVFSIQDPCSVKGVTFHIYRPDNMFNKEFFDDKYKTNEISEEEEKPGPGKKMIKIVVDGVGDHVKCEEHLHDLIDKLRTERLFCKEGITTCSMDLLRTLFVPFGTLTFAAIGNFYYPLQLLLQPREANSDPLDFTTPLNFANAISKARDFCKKDMDTLMKEYPKANDFDKQRLQNQCFKSLWSLTFLEFGLRLQPYESTNVIITNRINKKSIEWTLGAIESNYANMQEEVSSRYDVPNKTNFFDLYYRQL